MKPATVPQKFRGRSRQHPMPTLADTLRLTLPARQATLDAMLTSYPEVLSCLEKGGMGSGEESVPQMPQAWRYGSYPVLETLLKALRQNARNEPVVEGGITRSLYWHVAEWYLRCRRTRRPAYRLDKKQRRYQVMVAGQPQYELVTIRHEDVDPRRVLDGIEWIDAAWPHRLRLQPETPSDTLTRLEKVRELRGAAA